MLLLAGLLAAMPCSVFFTNLAWVLLLANWAAEWDWKPKWHRLRRNALLHAYLALFALAAAGLLWSENLEYGVDYLRRLLPWAAVPTVVLTSAPLRARHVRRLLALYVTAVLVVSAVGLGRFLLLPGLPHRQLVPSISHIRLALHCCMAIFLLLVFALEPMMSYYRSRAAHGAPRQRPSLRELAQSLAAQSHVQHFDWLSLLSLALILWLLLFLMLLQSYTALIILFLATPVAILAYWRRMPLPALRWAALLLWAAIGVAGGMAVGHQVREYYRPQPIALRPLEARTPSGNPYTHAQDGLMESGNYINNWVCERELAQEWQRRCGTSVYAPAGNGYAIYPALVRYLNAKGLAKDSAGVAQLSEGDLHAIARGVANPVYLHGISLKRMVYVMLFEYESGRKLHSVTGFTMLQRFDLWRAGWRVFKAAPLAGTGTGDVVDALHQQLAAQGSPLASTSKHTHNQYLTLLMTFGMAGCALLLLLLARAAVRHRIWRNPLLLIHLAIVAISCCSEDTLETLAGCTFVCVLGTLLSRPEPPHTPINATQTGE